MLTAADVEQKTFSTALRGYDLDEVDDFLDEIVATIKQLNEQLDAARQEAETPVATPAPMPEPELQQEPEPKPDQEPGPPPPTVDESAIGRALVAAQTAADQLLEEAQSEANKIVDEARSEAENLEAEKEAKRLETENEIRRFTDRVSSIRSELAVLAGEVSVKLDDMDSVIEGRHSGTETAVSGPENGDDEDDHQSAFEVGDGDETDDVSEVADSDDSPAVDDTDDGDESYQGADDEPTAEEATSDDAVPGDEDDSDQLGEILNGVASDLQLNTDEDNSSSEEDE
jgi:DivIVA domain-containing protein